MAYQEFYFDPVNGSNVNGGSSTAASAAYTSTNGNWNSVTLVFTPTDGSTPSGNVNTGDFASVYIDGATTAVYIGRVSAVGAGVNGTITIDSTANAGIAPATSATARSIKVGGACKGPNAADGSPLTLSHLGNLKDVAGDMPRFNLKNNGTYSLTSGITISGTSVNFVVQGYTSAVGDGGRATISGGSAGASFALVTINSSKDAWRDVVFSGNGSTGNAALVTLQGGAHLMERCRFTGGVGEGLKVNVGGVPITLDECEIDGSNSSNTASRGAINVAASNVFLVMNRCDVHDNTGTNVYGLYVGLGSSMIVLHDCIFDTNGLHHVAFGVASNLLHVNGGDYYNAGASASGAAISVNGTADNQIVIENAGIESSSTYAVDNSGTGNMIRLINVATFNNTSGRSNGALIEDSGAITLSASQWADPANGDFSTAQTTVISAGRGNLPMAGGYSKSTTAYPDVGIQGRRNPRYVGLTGGFSG